MEIHGKDGSKTLLREGIDSDFGRGFESDSDDRTVSRRHISFRLHTSSSERKDGIQVGFEVTGKNPIWVHNSRSGEIRVYRNSERGEMESGDSFCVSAKKPVWFNLRTEIESRELGFGDDLAESVQTSHGLLPGNEELKIEAGDFANIDPVKEFGFVVMGHEFDSYPKKMIRDSKFWDWFLEEAGEKSDDDDPGERKWKKGARRKRKKGDGNDDDDDDWTGESEEDVEIITTLRKVQKPKYSTRSKDLDKHIKDTRVGKKSLLKDNMQTDETDTEDEEDDETLGGFIVDDEGAVEDEEIGEAVEEEEDLLTMKKNKCMYAA